VFLDHDLVRFETGCSQHRRESFHRDRAGHATGSGRQTREHGRRQRGERHDVGHGKTPARLEDPPGLGQCALLIGTEIDDAVRHDDVEGLVGKWKMADVGLQKMGDPHACVRRVTARKANHLGRHVDSDDPPRASDLDGGSQAVEPCAASEVEHPFAWREPGKSGGTAATQATVRRARGGPDVARDDRGCAGGGACVGPAHFTSPGVRPLHPRRFRGPAADLGLVHATLPQGPGTASLRRYFML